MSTQENKELVRRYFDERWNRRNQGIIDELLPSSQEAKGAHDWVRSMLAIWGDVKLTILDLLAEGDQVAIHWRVDAVHQGEYLGVSATGKPTTWQGIAWLRIADGKIVSDVAYWDNLTILEQLGAAPTTA